MLESKQSTLKCSTCHWQCTLQTQQTAMERVCGVLQVTALSLDDVLPCFTFHKALIQTEIVFKESLESLQSLEYKLSQVCDKCLSFS